MKQLRIMVGLPASGKSTKAREIRKQIDGYLIESDDIRKRLFNNEQGKEANRKVFDSIHEMILQGLEFHGVVFDSTSLSVKNRMSIINKVKSEYPDVKIVADVMMTEYDICINRDLIRKDSVGIDVLKRMRENFQMPQYSEGFDEINIDVEYRKENYRYLNFEKLGKHFVQDNPNHTMTVYDHCCAVEDFLENEDPILMTAGFWHDYGKLFTKVFHNMKGEKSEIAHYYNHPNVGSYEVFFYMMADGFYSKKEIIYICGLIQYHMRPYMCKSQKAFDKLKNTVGQKMFDDLMILNNADRNCKKENADE